MKQIQYAYPNYARSERVADGIIHILGVSGALLGTALLLTWASFRLGVGEVTALTIYCLTVIAGFTASACYHMTPWEHFRPVLRRIDHAAIYLKIAGTYTPLVVMIGSLSSYLILTLVWGLAAFGTVTKLFYWQLPTRSSGTLFYLAMGWISVLIIYPLGFVMPESAIWLIIVGGLTYTSGVVFYKWESLKYSNAIWHGFVFVASGCFFAAITIGAVSAAG
ncbi:MAG: hemolysin III family protein [Pseudomonadota bacterium]